jgi:hypothetical protein
MIKGGHRMMDSKRRAILTTGAAVAATAAVPQVFAQQGGQRGGADLEKRVNVRAFGAVGNNVADDTAAIQSAIDYAATHGISGIYMPAGNYKITSSLYLDPPANLRARPVLTTKIAAFSLSLFGDENVGNREGFGTRIIATFNNIPAIWVGSGQGMLLKNLAIQNSVGGYRGNLPDNGGLGIAVAIVGGGGGSTRCRFENLHVENWRIAFKTGALGDGLGDSNTWIKCTVFNALIGIWISQTQNFINSVYDCLISATTSIMCINGGGCHVFGGNYSVPGNASAAFTISGVSALSGAPTGPWTFTAVIASPDIHFATNYNWYTFETAHFGIVPATVTAWNPGTGVATFQIPQKWYGNNYAGINLVTQTDIQAELQAATKVFCTECVTTFFGTNIRVDGVHIENDQPPTCLVHAFTGFGGDYQAVIKNVFFNTDASMIALKPISGATDANKARYYAAHTFPFIWSDSTSVTIKDCYMGLRDPIQVWTDANYKFTLEGCGSFSCNLTAADFQSDPINNTNAGVFDRLYFLPGRSQSTPSGGGAGADQLAASGQGGRQLSPHWTWRPAPWCTPNLTAADVTTLMGVLPAISSAGCTYPIIWGGQVYRICDMLMTSLPAKFHFVSNHKYYSYGQDLTTVNFPGLSWSYKGQSSVVYIDANAMKMMRVGLGITLNDGTADRFYVITAIFPGLGYIQVNSSTPGFVAPTLGTKTTIYTGSLIKQQPYAITEF